jgi:inosine-uridine nucleoside N-ribohydrolase
MRTVRSVALATMLSLFAMGVAAHAAEPTPRKLVLLDTDIGSDIDDSVALAYLLANPQCELLGITTVTGEPEKRAEMASALCRVAGKPNIPVYPGAAEPLAIPQRQIDVPQYAALGDAPRETHFPKGEAVEFLRRTIRAHPGQITLLAIGPLTNIGLLFRTDPEIPGMLKEVVLMCGKFGDQPLHWMNMDITTEWNAMLDPEATAIVFTSKPPSLRSYGLDVTLKVSMPQEEVAAHFSHDPLLRMVLQFAHVWFQKQKAIYFHDPLAAVNVFYPDVCTLERGAAEIELKNQNERGRTNWHANPAGLQQVAVAVRPELFFQTYFGEFDSSRN